MPSTLTWKLVDEIAASLGATEHARLKWRQNGRGVPPEWQIKIAEAQAAKGEPITFSQFAGLPSNPGRIAA